jgi:hypothetical protein
MQLQHWHLPAIKIYRLYWIYVSSTQSTTFYVAYGRTGIWDCVVLEFPVVRQFSTHPDFWNDFSVLELYLQAVTQWAVM